MIISATVQFDIDAENPEAGIAIVQGRLKMSGAEVITIAEAKRRRTVKQNNSVHLYLRLLADELKSSGYDLKAVLKEDADIPCTMENLKENAWRKVQLAMFGKKSTTELSTEEVNEIYLVVDKLISERTGISIPFPSIEDTHGV